MSQRRIGAVLLLSVIVPLLMSTIILIIFVMVLPNSSSQMESQNAQSAGNKSKQQVVSSLSSETRSYVLFILGIVFASSLFVFLIVIIVVVCTWVRRSKGYAVSDKDFAVTDHNVFSSQDVKLTKQIEKGVEHKQTNNSSDTKRGQVNPVCLAALPTPPLRTVAVTTQVTPKTSKEQTASECWPSSGSISGVETCPVVQPKNYGTLGRTHLLSTADEDGYYIDNLGFDPDEGGVDTFISTFDEQSPSTVYEDGFPNIDSKADENIYAEDEVTEGSSAVKVEANRAGEQPEKQLSKQDSFQGLPPFESFDKYLTLVRLDSSTSIESYSLEDSKTLYESIKEEDEKVEKGDTPRKE